MPVIQGSVSIPAASVNDNILTGSQFEYMPFDGQVNFYLVGDATAADLRCDVFSGQDILMENGQISNANRIPIRPDDLTLTDIAAAGERLKVRVRNTHATLARTINFAIEVAAV